MQEEYAQSGPILIPLPVADDLVLSLDPTSASAFQTLLFLHLHTDEYASALAVLDSSSLASSLEFERSYCLYRLHREKEALKVLQKASTSGRKVKHLEAQIVSRPQTD
jgi:signal recognition particle subunit SRP72